VTNHLRLLPNRTGTFRGRCAELCGIQHSVMNLEVVVMGTAEFDAWLEEQGEEQPELGQELFDNVCSKCHFAAPEYAPNIAGNPVLQDREQLEDIVTNGIRRMPPVGRGWSERELDALAGLFAGPGEQEDDGDES
jgi:mono/diheme cytochrome c family protein